MEPMFSQLQQFYLELTATAQQVHHRGLERSSEVIDEGARLVKASLAMWSDLSRASLAAWRQQLGGPTPPG